MAVVLIDGFDVYNGTSANTGLQAKWSAAVTLNSAGIAQSMAAGRFGGQCFRATPNAGSNNVGQTTRALPGSYSSIALGFAVRCGAVASLYSGGLPTILQLIEGSTYHLHLTMQNDGKLSVYRASSATAGTLLGTTSSAVILTSTWHYIEVEAVIHDTTGSVKVYVDGAQVLNLTGQDTRNGGSGVIDKIGLLGNGNSSSCTMDFDDLYIVDTATKLGERRVETIYPTSDVAQGFARSTGSANYSLVDEAQVNGDTDYVQGSSVGDVDTYGFGDLASTPSAISAIQVTAFAEKTDATTRQFAMQIKSGGTPSDGSNNLLLTSYAKFERIVETDPNTSAAWTASGVNALQGGPKVTV